MEYITKNGIKIKVEGNKKQIENGEIRECSIGANFVKNTKFGGLISSFNKSFSNETINIGSGMDIINTKIGNIKEAYEILKLKIKNVDTTDVYAISDVIIETVNDYFNGYANIDHRMKYYKETDFEKHEENKISNLKGTGAAMCVERAAVAQNLLISLGINSFFKTSGIINNNNDEVHSYNIIEHNNKYYIFDTSLPNLINGKPNPLIAEIDKEAFDLLSYPLSDQGISITVSHYNPYTNKDITITYDSYRNKQIEVYPIKENFQKNQKK